MIYIQLSIGARYNTRYKFITVSNTAAEACTSEAKPPNSCYHAQHFFVLILTYLSVSLSIIFLFQEQ